MTKILQIIPASEWVGRYYIEGKELERRLICFALCEETDGSTHMAAIDFANGSYRFCDQVEGFKGFSFRP